MIRLYQVTLFFLLGLVLHGCTVQKKKGDISTAAKIYHNTTARYNAYFNADVLMQEAFVDLENQHQENYNKLLPLFPFISAPNPKSVYEKLDKAIEKVSVSATVHEPSQWVDDCYVLMGKAQFLKQDYEAAEKTFEFFIDEFDPLGTRTIKRDQKNSRRKSSSSAKSKRPSRKTASPGSKKRASSSSKKKKSSAKSSSSKKKKSNTRSSSTRKKKSAKPGSKKRSTKPGSKKRPSQPGSKKRPEKTTETQKSAENNIENKNKVGPETSVIERESNRIVQTEKTPVVDSEKNSNRNPSNDIVVSTAGQKGMFGHKPVYQEGMLWLAKTYILRERYPLADYYLKQLQGDKNTPPEIQRQIPGVLALFHISRQDYDQAVLPLENAVAINKDKNLKARYYFVLAQLHQMQGRQDMAFNAYNEVIDLHPDYEMEFNAKLNLSRAAWASGKESADKTISRLEKMAKEEKNLEYRDQIHFFIGGIYLKLMERDLAIENFRKSVKFNVGNPVQKSESYYVLANYFYQEEEYDKAKFHYDSTLINLPQTDERYADVKALSENLKDIAINITTIELQDSLLRISRKSPEEQRKLAAAIKKKNELNAKPKTNSPSKKPGLTTALPSAPSGISATGKKSNFFAYDLNKVRRGQNEFRKQWGSRVLEDDWRRSNKPSSEISENTSTDDIARAMTDEEVKEILKNVPFNERQKSLAKQKIEEAYFNLGKLYREKLQHYDKAVAAHEKLLEINSETAFKVETYYYLYLSYRDMGNNGQANIYLDRLKTEFPDSKYTLSIVDPSYASNQLDEAKKLERDYDRAYSLFSSGSYNESSAILGSLSQLKDPRVINLLPKIDLLKAMCDGNLQGQDAYITSLNYVVKKHPNTPEETRAKEILRFIKGDKQAFDPILYEEQLEDFSGEENKLHYVLVVIYTENSKEVTSAKIDLSTYNQKYHKDERLKITSIYLNKEDGAQIILVRKFRNKKMAMDYYEGVDENRTEFIKGGQEYEVFAVTQKSYREIVKQKSVNAYRKFFEQQYLADNQ